jgi:hypothetical protein
VANIVHQGNSGEPIGELCRQHGISEQAYYRVGLPDDFGGAVAMLLASESGWISGQRIECRAA